MNYRVFTIVPTISLKRRLLNIATGLSLLLCVLTAVLWARSFWVSGRLEFNYRGELRRAWVRSGKIGIDNDPQVAAETAKRERAMKKIASIPGIGFLGLVPRAGVLIDPPSRIPPRWSRSSPFPLPVAIAIFAIAPIRRTAKWRTSHKRLAAGCCPNCGYDLTGNVSGVCPECGTPVLTRRA